MVQLKPIYSFYKRQRSINTRESTLGCARFAEFLQNFSDCQILWSLCSVVFHALTLKLPIQTSLSVAPKLPVYTRSGEKCKQFRKTSTPLTLGGNKSETLY